MVSYSKYHYDKKPILPFYERGPGPAGYNLPPLVGKRGHGLTHRIYPEYSFGLRLDSGMIRKNVSPGAAAYLIPQHLKATGYFAGYKYTCRAKTALADKNVTPSPNVYTLPLTDKYRNKAPQHILGLRTPLINKKVSPGPGAYLLNPLIGPKIPNRLAAGECSLKGSRKSKPLLSSPGPVYDIGSPEVIKAKSPAFTMRTKWKEFNQKWDAGPASYSPLFPSPCPCRVPVKGWTLGVRYNDYTGVFLTPCDKSRYKPLDDD